MEFAVKKFEKCDLITISGRVDSYTAPNIGMLLKSLISDGQMNIVIDLEKVSYLSSSGLLVFVNAQKSLNKQKCGRIRFSGTSELIFSAFSLAGFDKLFDFYANTTSAVESFREF